MSELKSEGSAALVPAHHPGSPTHVNSLANLTPSPTTTIEKIDSWLKS